MYQPEEDSYLMEKYVKEFARGKVLEIGCGSGILMEAALKKSESVIGVDVDDESLRFCRKKGLNVKKSDLFSKVNGKWDFIIFNPPYLPEDENEFISTQHIDLVGGKYGYEVIERFFSKAGKYLNEKGEVLILFSSLTNKSKVESIMRENGFSYEKLEEKSVGLMERLYVYLCRKF